MAKAYDITTLSPDIQNQIKSSMRNIGDEFRLPSGESIVKVSDTGYMTGSGEMNTPIGKVFFNTEPIPVRSARDTADLQRGQQNELQKQALERELARIETETQNRINEQTKLGEENLAKTRGINIRSGLSGSPFAESLKGEVKALTASAVASERTKGTELRARATGTFNENIQKIEENYNSRMALIQQNEASLFKEKSELATEEKKQALGDFDLLAKSGSVDFDKLKEQGLLEGYSKQTGKSSGELELRFNAQLPKTEASDFRWGKNGEAYQYNKITGEFLRRPDLDEGGGTGFEGKVQMLGDQIFIIPDKFTYDPTNPKSQADQLKDQMIPYGKTGEFKVGGGITPTDITEPISLYQEERATRTIQSVDELYKKVDENKGIFGRTAAMPIPDFLRSDAYRNFVAELDTLKSNIAFGELTAMREASKTGGALGQVSDREGQLLQSALGALSITQSPENFKLQLEKVKDSINRWRETVGSKPIGEKNEETYTTQDGVEYVKGEDGLYYPK